MAGVVGRNSASVSKPCLLQTCGGLALPVLLRPQVSLRTLLQIWGRGSEVQVEMRLDGGWTEASTQPYCPVPAKASETVPQEISHKTEKQGTLERAISA